MKHQKCNSKNLKISHFYFIEPEKNIKNWAEHLVRGKV